MPGPYSIAPAQLMRLIGLPDAPIIVDVRLDDDFALDPCLIPGARRIPHAATADLHPELPGTRAVVICQRGHKLSEGAAALLRLNGFAAEVLDGGMEDWRAAALPAVPMALIPKVGLWVTRQRPKIDRIACPWLIRRFVDRDARFLFVPPAEVGAVADRFGAVPFDTEGVTFSHRGNNCTFDALLDDFGLHTPTLDRLANVVRGADTDRHDLAPQSAGLLALSVGLSRQFRHDLQQLDAGMTMYDALYRWARDGYDEGHDWPAGRMTDA